MRRHFLIIHNAMAGGKHDRLLQGVTERLRIAGCRLDFEVAGSIDEDKKLAEKAVSANEVDAVVAAGGDSTVRGVAGGLLDSSLPLGVIPSGTANVLALEMGLAFKADKVAECLMHGEARPLPVGLANGEPFILMAGIGFDAEIVRQLDHGIKQYAGKAAYIWPVLKALATKPPHLSVCFDEASEKEEAEEIAPFSWRDYTAGFVVVSKARHYGGRFLLAPEASLDSGAFQVVMFMDRSRLGLARALIGMALGRNARTRKTVRDREGRSCGSLTGSHGVMIRACKAVHIKALQANAVPTQVDGEWLGATPLEVRSCAKTFQLIRP